MGKVTAYCSKECLAIAENKDDGVAAKQPSPPAPVVAPIEIASTAPAKRDDTIGAWAIGDDTAIRKYSVLSTAEREVLPPAKKSRAMLVLLLVVLLGAGGFGVYHYVIR